MKKLIIVLLPFICITNASEIDNHLLLLSNDRKPKEICIPSDLTKFSPVLKKTVASRNYMNSVTSFGYSEKELKLLKLFLMFERDHQLPKNDPNDRSFKQRYAYESAFKIAVEDFQKKFIPEDATISNLDQQFALAHFFMLHTIPIVIADLQTSPSHSMQFLSKLYHSTDDPLHKEMLNEISKRYIEKKRYAKEKYFFCKHHTEDRFFQGVKVQDLIDHNEIRLLLYPNHNMICLNKNNIKTLDGLQNIANISEYTKIYASCNQLHTVQRAIESCLNLRSIYLNENFIKTVPTYLNLKHLEELHLNKNEITEIPSDMGYLQHLKLLNLDNNKIETIPDAIIGLAQLQELSLKGNFIKNIPLIIDGLQNLMYLNLNDNKFTEIPSHVTGLNSLKTLCLAKNSIHEIPALFTGFENLQELSLYHNHIAEIPQKVEGLRLLHTLDLGSNNITFANLNIKSNILNVLRKKSPIKGYNSLKQLYLMNNNLSIEAVTALEKSINRSRSKRNRLIIKAIDSEDLFM